VRGRQYLLYVGLPLAVVVLLNLPVPAALRLKSGTRDGLAPFQNMLSLFVRGAHDALASTLGAVRFETERQRLQSEIGALRLQVQTLKALEQDNEALRRQVAFRERQRCRLVLCEVVTRGDAGGWWQTIQLNRGSADGVGLNMAAITADGLVGKTVKVSRQTCDVLLITDPNCKVACEVQGARAFGILRGTGVSLVGNAELEMLYSMPACQMDYLHRDTDVPAGTPVLTSEISGVYPEGLLVGRVAHSALDASKLYRRAEVVPAADLGRLRYVFVVLGPPGHPAEAGDGQPAATGGTRNGTNGNRRASGNLGGNGNHR
jgi:rod shape-determining protein MreC